MNSTPPDPISRLSIPPEKKSPRKGSSLTPVWVVLLVLFSLFAALKLRPTKSALSKNETTQPPVNQTNNTPPPPRSNDSIVLTVTGYIVPRERIELTAKFPATVQSIPVRKGDQVKRGDVLVQMVDSTYQAKVTEAQGRLALANANLAHAQTNYHRELQLKKTQSGTDQNLDDAYHAVEVAKAEQLTAQGQLSIAETHLSWCTIQSPIDGTILERLADPDEVVIPQGYGGPERPVTTLVAVADLTNLQVEVDVNELDTPKVHLNQKCKVSPVAYPDKSYQGFVAEIAPEANRQKGTLQIKVQIENPDNFLTPDLYAKVEFE